MNCSVSHGENDTNICELQHVWNVHPALLWIAPWNFLPLSWSPPTQTSGDFLQWTVLDHKVQDRILIFAASIHMFDASTFLMGKSPSLRLTSPKKLVLKPLFFMVKSHGGQVFRVKSPCTPQDLGSLAERTGWGDDATAGMVRLPPWVPVFQGQRGQFVHPLGISPSRLGIWDINGL